MPSLRNITAVIVIIALGGVISCSRVSPTVTPDPLEEIVTAGDLGSIFPQIQDVSPGEINSLDVNPAMPTGISATNPGISVIFSRIMENDGDEMYFSLELIEDPGGAATSLPYTLSPVSTSSTVFTMTPLAALSESTEYVIRIHDNAEENEVPSHTLKFDNLPDMYPAASALSPANPTYVDYIFETGTSVAADTTDPTVSAVVPANGATDITPDIDPNGYIDITLADAGGVDPSTVNGSTLSLYNTTDSLPVSGTLYVVSSTNYRVYPDEALDYDKTYRMRISVGDGIADISGNTLGQTDYVFSTVAAVSAGNPAIDNYEVTAVTDTSVTVTWSTSLDSITHLELDDAATFAAADVTVHDTTLAGTFSETVAGLTPNTLYSLRICADNEAPGAAGPFDTTTTVNGVFRTLPDTSEGATGNYEVEASGTAKSGMKSYQLSSDEFFIFWSDTTAGEVWGQYFDTSAGPADTWDRWPDTTSNTGSQVFSSAGDVTLAAGTDNDVFVLMTDGGGGIYGELIYDNAGTVGRRWGGGAAGVNLYSGTADETTAALSYSGYVTAVTTGTASLDFLYDDAVDFLSPAVTAGDHLINEASGDHTTVSTVLDDGLNSHLLILGAPIISSGAGNQAYRIGDALTTETGNSMRAGTAAIIYTDNGLLDTGDVLFLDRDGVDTDAWLYLVSGATWNAGPGDFSYDVNLSSTYDASGDTFTTYDFISNGTADTNWLYENGKDFTTAGGGVSVGDVVINTATGEADQVHADGVASESNDVLKLADSGRFIFDTDGEGYQILRLEDSSSYLSSGRNSAFSAATVTDSDEDFITDGVQVGDIVYNITTDRYAEVTSVAATVLGISESVFTATNQLFIVFRFKGLTVTWSEGSDILGKTVDSDDGSFLYPAPGAVGTSFTITNTATACSNPFSVADTEGNILVVYEYNNGADIDIRAKKIKSDGSFVWSDPADDATDAGISLVANGGRDDLIKDVFTDGYGGAWVIYTSHDATLRAGVAHIQDDGTVSTMPASALIADADYPAAVRLSGTDNMVMVYESIETISLSMVRRIYGIKFQSSGGNPTLVAGSSINVTASVDPVSQVNPRILDDGGGGYVVSWLDMMYYPSVWYTLFAEHIDSGNSRQYGTTGRYAGIPVRQSPGDDNPYTLIDHLMLNYDNGGGAVDAGIIFWLDERNGAGNGDIYIQDVVD